jgi:cation transport regulator ChaC
VSDHVWYFAYGSNMQPATFRDRRGITPARAAAACLSGWRLVLDKPPILPVRESMANVVEDATARVYGVAYAVTAADLAHIDLTEGVLIDNYRRVAVRVAMLDDGRVVDAFTLTSERRDPTLLPSRRYMALLVEGATAHGLPAAYVDWLRSLPAGEDTPEGQAARAIIDRALKKEPR